MMTAKGNAPLATSPKRARPMAWMMNRFMPTGGVNSASSIRTSTSWPAGPKRTLKLELAGDVTLDFARKGLRAIFDLPLENLRATDGKLRGDVQRTRAPSSEGQVSLEGKTVLLVGDEHLVANEVAECLSAGGCCVVGPVPSLERAMRAAGTEELDAAVLEVNLNGELVWPAAKVLRARRIPFVFATGYSGMIAPPPELAAAPWIEKPVEPKRLASVVATVVEDR